MLLKFAFICLIGLATSEVSDPLPTIPTTLPPKTTTPPETTTSTEAPTTTTTSTTKAPDTTTSAAPTTTAPPAPSTPVPPASAGSWSVVDPASNVTCIIAKMAVQMSVTYSIGPNKTSVGVMDVPANSSASGSCGNETQTLLLSWTPTGATGASSMLLTFTQNTTAKCYHIDSIAITLQLDQATFPGATASNLSLTSEPGLSLPGAPLAMSYRCTPSQNYNLTDNSTLNLSQLQLQAFHTQSGESFGSASECPAQDSADIVPIAVGCALAALVVVVLVAYLIGRRRSHAKGYLSM